MGTTHEIKRGQITLKMRTGEWIGRKPVHEDVIVEGDILGQFGVAKYPLGGWTVTHLATGSALASGGIKRKKDAINLMVAAHEILGDVDVFVTEPPMDLVIRLREAVREYRK